MVTLNDSDDSESDGEPSNSTNSVFGGLESMIKEARRNVEVNIISILFCSDFALYVEFKLQNLIKTCWITSEMGKSEYVTPIWTITL